MEVSKGDRAKDAILTAAIELFAKHGFDQTSVQMIAKKAKVSATSPLYYFESRDGLMFAALQRIVRHNSEAGQSQIKLGDSALERLRSHFRSNLKWAIEFPEEASIILYTYYMASVNENWNGTYAKILEAARGKIEELLHASQREKVIASDVDARKTSELLHDILLGGIVNAVSGSANGRVNRKAIEEKWETSFRKLLGA